MNYFNTFCCKTCKTVGYFYLLLLKDLNHSQNTGMEVSPLHLPLRRWLTLGRKEDPAVAVKAESELLTPTLIRSWKAAMFTSQVYTQVFPLGCPSSIVCDRCSGLGLWWHCCGAWAGDRAQHPIYHSSVPPLHTHKHRRTRHHHCLPYPITWSTARPQNFSLNAASSSSSFLLIMVSQPSRLPGGCFIKLMMLLHDTKIKKNITRKSVDSCK